MWPYNCVELICYCLRFALLLATCGLHLPWNRCCFQFCVGFLCIIDSHILIKFEFINGNKYIDSCRSANCITRVVRYSMILVPPTEGTVMSVKVFRIGNRVGQYSTARSPPSSKVRLI